MALQETGGVAIPRRRKVRHYYGDEVRVLFVVGAVILIFAQSTGANLQLTTTEAVLTAALLVITAGITSPTQNAIHWVNAVIAMIGTLFFGSAAIEHYRTGASLLNLSFGYVETLAIISLIALYLTTRTIRGKIHRAKHPKEPDLMQ